MAEHPGWSQHKHLQARSCQGHHSLHPAGFHFIINCCLANKGRVQVKNIQNFQTEGICRARVDSQPLTENYKYLPSYSPGRATILLLVAEIVARTFPQEKSEQATRHSKNRRRVHSLLSVWSASGRTPVLSIFGF